MHHPDDIAGLPTQPHQGVAARLARRFGGMARTAIAVLTRRRRSAASPATPSQAAAATRQPPAPPGRPRTSRSTNAPPRRRAWIASWFGRRPPTAWPLAALSDSDDILFTPERYPELTPGACALLNTPVEDLDLQVLQVLLSALTAHIAGALRLSPTDAEALFGTLCQRLGSSLGQPGPDDALPGPPDEAPAAPDAPPAPPRKAQATAAPRNTPVPAAPTTDGSPQPASRRSRSRRRDNSRRRRIKLTHRPGGRQHKPQRPRYAAGTGPPA